MLKLLATVDAQLSLAKGKPDTDTTVLGGPAIVILIGDFYQFPSVVKRLLWKKAIMTHELHGKAIWNHFTSVIILTQQMGQQNNKVFHNLLTRARKGLLNNNNVDTLNNRIASSIPIDNVDKNEVIVQQNATRHIINRLQINRFAQANRRDVIIFLGQYTRTRKEGGQVVENKELLTIQDGEGKCIGPGLFYYCRGMPTYLLSNVCTKLGMVNGARGIIQGFIPYLQGMLLLSHYT